MNEYPRESKIVGGLLFFWLGMIIFGCCGMFALIEILILAASANR